MIKAMILAAGKGTRMRPLTDYCPKPLLTVHGQPLIEWHLQRLRQAGITEVVINCAYLGEQIERYIGSRENDGLSITVLNEGAEPLETAGGIVNALSALTSAECTEEQDEPFLVINGDVWIDLDFRRLRQWAEAQTVSGTLVLVDNPDHNPDGDFSYQPQDSLLLNRQDGLPSFTYSGVSMFKPSLFESLTTDSGGLGPHLKRWADQHCLAATHYSGYWLDVGTPERLAELAAHLDDLHYQAQSHEDPSQAEQFNAEMNDKVRDRG